MTEIEFKGTRYGVDLGELWIRVSRRCRFGLRSWLKLDEEAARRSLGDHGLPKRNARRLLDAELRGIGPYANPAHPLRR